jgi:ecotin
VPEAISRYQPYKSPIPPIFQSFCFSPALRKKCIGGNHQSFLFQFFCVPHPIFSSASNAEDTRLKELANFPKAKENWQRFVVLPTSPKSGDLKLEIIAAEEIMRDACNHVSFAASLVTKKLPGFQYSYYELDSADPLHAMTAMACRDSKKQMKLTNTESLTITVNKKFPVVVYLPKPFILQYRLRNAGETFSEAKTEK